MADPANIQKELLDTLKQIRKSLDKMNTTASGINRAGDKSATKKADELQKSLDTLNKTVKQVNGEQTKQITSIKAIGKGIGEMIGTMLPAVKNFKSAINETNYEFSKIIRNSKDQSGNYQTLAKKTFEFIKTQNGAVSIIRNSIMAQKQYNDIITKGAKNQNKLTSQDFVQLSSALEDMIELQKSGVNVFAGLNKHQLAFLKLSKSELKDKKLTDDQFKRLNGILEVVNKNFDAVSKTTPVAVNGIGKFNKAMVSSAMAIMKSLGAAVAQAFPVALKDLKSQARNAVAESNYLQAGRMGVSQGDLSDFIGQNRMALRTIGGGKASAAIDSGQVLEMQKKAQMFGLIGAEGLKYSGETMQRLMNVGITPSVQNVSKQMDMMYETMQKTGMTFDELNSVADELSQSPAFLSIIRASGYEDQSVQTSALLQLVKINGYSSSYLKEMLEIEQSKKYQGISELVKGMIGVKLAGGQINRMLGREAISPEQMQLLELGRGRDKGALQQMFKQGSFKDLSIGGQNVYDKFSGPNADIDFAAFIDQQRMYFNTLREEAQSKAGAGDLYGGAINKTILGKFLDFAGSGYDERDQTLQAEAKRHAMYGTGLIGTKEQQQVMLGKNDTMVKTLDEVNNAFIVFNSKLFDAVQIFEGMQANPAGGAGLNTAKNLLSAGGDIASMFMMGKMMKGMGGMGSLGGGLGKMFGKGGGMFGKLFGGGAVATAGAAGAEGIIAKEGAKIGGKSLGKSLLKKIPIIGLLAGLGFAVQRSMDGDFAGAGLEVASGAASLLPGFGTAASVAIDAGIAGRDVYKAVQDTGAEAQAAGASVPTNAPDSAATVQVADPGAPTINELMTQSLIKMQELIDIQKTYLDTYTRQSKDQLDLIKQTQDDDAQQFGRASTYRFNSISP